MTISYKIFEKNDYFRIKIIRKYRLFSIHYWAKEGSFSEYSFTDRGLLDYIFAKDFGCLTNALEGINILEKNRMKKLKEHKKWKECDWISYL